MLSKFSLYDFIAVIIPGVFFLWALQVLAPSVSLSDAIPLTGGLSETSVLIVVGYVAGLLLQGISELLTENVLLRLWGGYPSARFLLPDEGRLSAAYRSELAGALGREFGITLPEEKGIGALQRNQEIFYRCYRAIDKLSDLPQTFLAQYALFRSLFTTFLILSVVALCAIMAAPWVAFTIGKRELLVLLAFLCGSVIAYLRMLKRSDDFAKCVYDVFLAHFERKAPREGNTGDASRG